MLTIFPTADFFTLLPLHDLLTPASPPRNLAGFKWKRCNGPGTIIEDWHIRTFRPKWFGLFGEPAPIIYQTPHGLKAHHIAVVDIDKRDIELQLWVDQEYMGYHPVELNSTVDCGVDIVKCLNLDFASGYFVVRPGRHAVRAEIRKREYGSISSPNPLMSYQVMNLKPLFGGRNVREESCGW